jgi:polar amino acid transport system substrate-binding protein
MNTGKIVSIVLPLLATLLSGGANTGRACAQPAQPRIPQPIQFCSNEVPRVFYKRVNGRPTDEVTGYSFDYVKGILSPLHLAFKVELIPFPRCLADVEHGSRAVVLHAIGNPERDKKFLVSKPYFESHGMYFYRKSNPVGEVKSLADLHRFRVCGLEGRNYNDWGFEDGQIDMGAKTTVAALGKLNLGRCDVVLSQFEAVMGLRWISDFDPTQNPDLAWGEVPGMPAKESHFMVCPNLLYSQELLKILNDGIDRMTRSGKARELERKYSGK